MKSLNATKIKDGWYVEIIDHRQVSHKQEVFTLARQEGLKINTELLKYQKDKIFAD